MEGRKPRPGLARYIKSRALEPVGNYWAPRRPPLREEDSADWVDLPLKFGNVRAYFRDLGLTLEHWNATPKPTRELVVKGVDLQKVGTPAA